MSLLQTMRDYINRNETHTTDHETVNPHQEAEVSPLVSFVTTDLKLRMERLTDERDIERDGKVYRKLTPEYFAWLRSRMVQAHSAHENVAQIDQLNTTHLLHLKPA